MDTGEMFTQIFNNRIIFIFSFLFDRYLHTSKMCSNIVKLGVFKHLSCRNSIYPQSDIKRFTVPDEFVFWSCDFTKYDPPSYTSEHIHGKVYADPEIGEFNPKWNTLDGQVNRVSHMGQYKIDNSGCPLNPIGRTGLRGRGLLGRWGPNHAADPIVTRWKRTEDGAKVKKPGSNKNILEMVAIQRHDNKMWAIPGGMVDPGEKVTTTLKREFIEEALDSLEQKKLIDEFFAEGKEIYKGYVDDFRNTDNSWIETVAYNFHDESGVLAGKLDLCAGDDAVNVKWQDVNSEIVLHANHKNFVKAVAELLNAA
ncbi:putative nudix hydrolase 6 isoform X2 [Condylostylus longicornis]|nr:putative nudix hydrolase 6 isoform X2 [Condylostylus longicornis]